MSDIFISYSQVDREFISQLRRALAKQGEEVWIDWEAVPILPVMVERHSERHF